MLTSIRETLRAGLSPQAYERVRMGWWNASYYIPHRLASVVVRRTPIAHGRWNVSETLESVTHVNVFAPTEMCRVMTRHGSDKGKRWHNYTTIYSALLSNLRNEPLTVFEVGLGTNNPSLASTMGVHGRPGASLRGWRELFPNARIFGADIDREVLFTEPRIETLYCDQTDPGAIRALWAVLKEGADLIIDDGLHTFEANVCLLKHSLDKARRFYVVEDIRSDALSSWELWLNERARQFHAFGFLLVGLPNAHNSLDNNLLIIERRH